jgi:hypothetical protein
MANSMTNKMDKNSPQIDSLKDCLKSYIPFYDKLETLFTTFKQPIEKDATTKEKNIVHPAEVKELDRVILFSEIRKLI